MGILDGLKLCWDHGCRKVLLSSDSAEALNLIAREHSGNHPMRSTIDDIRDLLMRDWSLTYEHVFREAKTCANSLANRAHEMLSEFTLIPHPPPECGNLLSADRCTERHARLF